MIRHDHNEATSYNEDDFAEIMSNKEFDCDKGRLLDYGRLSSKLLECLWVSTPPYGNFDNMHEFLFELYLPMCRWYRG